MKRRKIRDVATGAQLRGPGTAAARQYERWSLGDAQEVKTI